MIQKTESYDLSRRNTFRMKVSCRSYVEVTEPEDLLALDFDALPQPLFVMGGGSNLLFTKDFPGTVLHLAIRFLDFALPGSARNDKDAVSVISEGGAPAISPQTEGGAPVISTKESGTIAIPSQAGGGTPVISTTAGGGASVISTKAGGRVEKSVLVRVGAGVVFDDFCAWAAQEGLWGPENLSYIPGEVGASAVQNIGAYGVEAKDVIETVHAFDLQERRFVDIPGADCAYGYRTSLFKTAWKGRYLITAVTFRLSTVPQPKLDYGGVRKALEKRMEDIITPTLIRETIVEIRRAKLPEPEEVGSAGSFFCNPVVSREHFGRIVAIAKAENGPEYEVPHYEVGERVKVPAAWMIDQCGFKGMRLGGAQVYPKQPLVIVNATGDATPDEIVALERRIIDTIREKYGVELHPEVEHVEAKGTDNQ